MPNGRAVPMRLTCLRYPDFVIGYRKWLEYHENMHTG